VSDDIYLDTIPAYLESILLNIISNAIKYHNPDKKPIIEIKAQKEDDFICLFVKDNGLGIDLHRYREKLFGMYKTFHNNENARGFGLYITKSQVETLGGKIEVESQPNKGSNFKIYFYAPD
jgi:signal transduction histidine kinase